MKRTTIILGLLCAASVGLLAACGGGGKPGANKSTGPEKITRPEVAADYKGKTKPATASAEEGKKVFDAQCASCHGAAGNGDTAMGKALKPPSSDLTNAALQDAIGDDYIFWRISEGGAFEPFNSGMTSFKAMLNEEQRWNLVAYVRTLKK